MTIRLRSALVSALVSFPFVAMPAASQQATHIEGLGTLTFPNSGAAEAQHDFLRGVLLLHSFEYSYAAEAFRKSCWASAAPPDRSKIQFVSEHRDMAAKGKRS